MTSDGPIWIQPYLVRTATQQRWIAVRETGEVVASQTMKVALDAMERGRDYAIDRATDGYDGCEIRMQRFVPPLVVGTPS